MISTPLSDGWVRHSSIGAAVCPKDHATRGDYWNHFHTTDGHGPIHMYDSGGIGPVEWTNALHDRALILDADGTWHNGAEFHLWYSAGGGSVPREITWHAISGPKLVAGDHLGWREQLACAIEQTEGYVGIRPL